MENLRFVFEDAAQRKLFLKEATGLPVFRDQMPEFELDGTDGLLLEAPKEAQEELVSLANRYSGFTWPQKIAARPLFQQQSYEEKVERWDRFMDNLDRHP